MIKAIVTDMDGTLLNGVDEIDTQTYQALMDAQAKGISVILASGRNKDRLAPYTNLLHLKDYQGKNITVNGLLSYDFADGEVLEANKFTLDEIHELFAYGQGLDVEVQACHNSGMYYWYGDRIKQYKIMYRKENNLSEDYPWTGGPWFWCTDMRNGYPTSIFVNEAKEIDYIVNKVVFFDEEANIEKIYPSMIETFGDRFEIFRTCPRALEILPKGVDKGSALKQIMDKYKWQKEEVLVFGDGENDVSMFQQVAHSVAMGQAEDFVKAQASYITKSNNEAGIYHALQHFGVI